MKIRTFIAVDPSEEVLRRLADRIRVLEKQTKGFRWVRPEGIHLTLKFLGEIEEETVTAVDDRLGQLTPSFETIPLEASGIGFFPGPDRPHIVWVGLQGEIGRLVALQSQVAKAVQDLPVKPEEARTFTPHLTLARIPNFRAASGVSVVLKTAPEASFGKFIVDRLFLYKSRLTPQGAKYTKLKEYPLGRT